MSMLQENSGLSYSMVVSIIGVDRIWELISGKLQDQLNARRVECFVRLR